MPMNERTPPGPSPQALIALHETAAAWFMRRNEASWTGADERALNAWLAADPLHREIYDGMALTGHDLHQLPWARDPSWRVRTAPPAAPSPAVRRRAWAPAMAAACLLLALGGGYGWYRWDRTPAYVLDAATARGETRTIDLPDGSRVALNFDSALRVRYYPRRREVVLARGEAFFRVTADAGRPFTVDSGASEVRVVGTAFNVRAAPPQLVVKVLEGRVELRPDRRADEVLAMGPGAGLAVDPASGRHQAVAAAPESVGDWRRGQLQFQRTPLGEVAQELARYLGKPIVLAGADLAQQPISGVAATATPELFLQALPGFLPLQVERLPDGSWRIARR